MNKNLRNIFFVALTTIGLAACGGGGDTTINNNIGDGGGNLSLIHI